MNKSYKTIYNIHTQSWVAVSEITVTEGKVSSSRVNRVARPVSTSVRLGLTALASALLWVLGAPVAMAADAYCAGTATQNYGAAGDQVVCGEGAVAAGIGGIAVGAGATYNGNTYVGASSSGAGSIAIGTASNAASGTPEVTSAATAVGFGTFAAGSQAAAFGTRARAEVTQSIAIGNDTRATGTGSVSIGGDDSNSYNRYVFPAAVVGYSTNAGSPTTSGNWRPTFSAGDGALAISPHAQALTQGSTAIGVGATAGEGTRGAATATAAGVALYAWTPSTTSIEATAVGALSGATKAQSTAVGYKAMALAKNALVVGANASAAGENSIVLGTTSATTTAAANSVAIGSDSDVTGEGSVAIGKNVDVSSARSVAIGGITSGGVLTKATAAEVVALGAGAQATLTKGVAIGTEALTTSGLGKVGYIPNGGTGSSTVDSTKSTWKSTHAAVAIGDNTLVNGYAKVTRQITGLAAGTEDTDAVNVAQLRASTQNYTSVNSTGPGNRPNDGAKGADAIAIGLDALAGNASDVSGTANAIAMGNAAQAAAQNSIAIGKGAQATAAQAISIGTGNVVSGEGSGALGDPSFVSGAGTYTIGNNNGTAAAPVAATESGAFGNNNALPTASTTGIRVVGNSNTVNSSNVMVMGNSVTVGTGLDGAVVLGNASTVSKAVDTASSTIGGITFTYATDGAAPADGDVVSVGTATAPRQIQNVANGQVTATSLDAINGSQLYAVAN